MFGLFGQNQELEYFTLGKCDGHFLPFSDMDGQ